MKNLTLRIEALEAATPTAPPQAPPREEGGRANGHRVVPQYQGADGKNSSLHHTLVKGEQHLHNSSRVLDFPESSHRRDYDGSFQHKDYKLPRLDFPKFDGSHPKIWKEKCEKYFSMFNVPPHTCGPTLPLFILKATLNFGCKPMKHSMI